MILLCPGKELKSMNYECGIQKECRLRQRELFNLLQAVKFWCKIILYRRLLQIFGLEVLFMEMLVFGIAAAVSYWYETEVFCFWAARTLCAGFCINGICRCLRPGRLNMGRRGAGFWAVCPLFPWPSYFCSTDHGFL